MPPTPPPFPSTPPTTAPSPRREPVEPVPLVPWSELYAKLARGSKAERFAQGDHVTVIGPTGSGKTHVILELVELRDYVIFVACKPADPLIGSLAFRGYHVTPRMELEYVEKERGRMEPVHRKVVYWPRFPEKLTGGDMEIEKKLQRPAVKSAISYVRRNRSWTLVLDEATWVCRDLNLQRDVDSALFQFRTLDSSVILGAQRPSWVGQYALSQAQHLFLFHTAHGDDLKRLGDISGVNIKRVRECVSHLSRQNHELCYVNTRTMDVCRTIAPERPGGKAA